MAHVRFQTTDSTRDQIRDAVRELVTIREWGDSVFLNLPFFFPSGTAATVKVYKSGDKFVVTDNGFAFRELEAIGAERSFGLIAAAFSERAEIEKNRRAVFVEATPDDLARAISDVASVSWQVVDKVYADREEEDEGALEEELTTKLISLFGEPHVAVGRKLRGISATEWGVSALVDYSSNRPVVFQAVSNHPTSVYRTNSAFHDLAAIPKAPKLIAVVRNKKALGPRLGLLSQAGRVIEENQSEDVFRKAVAA
jgi:hypothetical protein